jgi:cytochrome c553
MMGTGMRGMMGPPSGTTRSGDVGRGRRLAANTCAACHGPDGNSTDPRYPKLAGQHASYLHRRLLAFRSGFRRSDVMVGVAAKLSDADMADLAAFFSQQARRRDAVGDRALAERGRQIFEGGFRPMGSACVMCHAAPGQGRTPMMGMMGDTPVLNGQHAAYLVDQLHRFAAGERQASAMMGMMMERIAAALPETEARAVAEYLSGLP